MFSRREFLAAPAVLAAATPGREIRIKEVTFGYEEFPCRTPLKFGGHVVERLTVLNVHCTISGGGRTAKGFGSMPLGNTWSFPSAKLSYTQTLDAMKALAVRIAKITGAYGGSGHPCDINMALEPEYIRAAAEASNELELAEPIPKLCTLVTASPFDAAIHDAYGKLHGRSTYSTYDEDFMRHDLAHYLLPEFKGDYLSKYLLANPKPAMPMYHLVGALDPITEADVQHRLNDGLPQTLPEWIDYNGLTHFKIKLNGDDLKWDVERVVAIDRTVFETQHKRGVTRWVYSADFNEKCANVDYLIAWMQQVKERTPEGFARLQYIEQPTARDLKTHRENVMHQAAKLRPVVIDESLTDLESLLLAREMGYTGVALKACKGQTQSLLMAAAAQKYKMFLCVQDLTCPGASLVHSAGLAAHVPGVAAIEANAREYLPAANRGWEKKKPGIFIVKDGMMRTGELTGPGLGAV